LSRGPRCHGARNIRRRQWALEHLHKPLALTDLAEQSHMSLRTFARRFNDEVGTSPGRWLIQQRVGRARHLLESIDLAVDEIASQVGFAGVRRCANTCTPLSASHHSPTGAPSEARRHRTPDRTAIRGSG
jgi:transcriptional regulator GlxA family with amidase domain